TFSLCTRYLPVVRRCRGPQLSPDEERHQRDAAAEDDPAIDGGRAGREADAERSEVRGQPEVGEQDQAGAVVVGEPLLRAGAEPGQAPLDERFDRPVLRPVDDGIDAGEQARETLRGRGRIALVAALASLQPLEVEVE